MLQFPDELNITYTVASTLSTADIEKLFAKAEEYGILDEYSDYFFTQMSVFRNMDSDVNLQRAVLYLEDYKRHLGRRYSRTKDEAVRQIYNQVEFTIQYTVTKFNLYRRTQPYMLQKSTCTRCEEPPKASKYVVKSKFNRK
jgi:hypothetical protein